MGTVYEAWQVSLQRVVALKVLSTQVAATPKAVARFRREAQAAAKLHHTHIVPIFAQGEADGNYFYAMEYVEGESLHANIAELRRMHRPDKPGDDQAETVAIERSDPTGSQRTQTAEFSVQAEGSGGGSAASPTNVVSRSVAFGAAELFLDVARHLADVADALDYAHAQGVIHRDIKPHNLLFGRDGRLRVSDFGLARLAEQPGVTITGEMIGSPLYMSPEQITGDPNLVDHRTDIYSLGATLYELAALQPVFDGSNREELLRRITTTAPAPLRKLQPAAPAELETILLKALDKDPADRYASAQELADDLRRFVAHEPIHAKGPSLAARARKWARRHPSHLLAATLVLAVSLIAALMAFAVAASERQKTAAALEKRSAALSEADQQRQLAIQSLDTARRAVDKMYTKLALEWIADETAPSGFQQEIL